MVNIERAGGARKISVLSIIGIILVPVIVAGGFVWAVWHAGDRMDNVSAAIVNKDEPVKVDGSTVPLGRQLASGLVTGDEEAGSSDENYDWQITDQDDAKSGLKSGKYAVAVTIPENFSSAATSYSKKDGDKARHATLDVTTSNVTGIADPAVSNMIASAATKTLNSNLTKSYLKNIYVGFNDIGQQFSKVADSAGDLADGEDKLGKGIHKTHHGAKGLADGLDKLDSGADNLASGADDLASGADDLASGQKGLANGLNKLDQQTSSLPGQTQKLANGAQQLSSASGKVAGGVDQLASAVHGLNTKLQSAVSDSPGNGGDAAAGVQQYANGVNQYVDSVQQMADSCQQQGGDPAFCQKLKKVAAQGSGFQSQGKKLSDGVSKMADGLDQLPKVATGVNTLDSKVSKLANGADGVSSGADSLASGTQKLANGMGPLSKGISQSADGADKLAGGADKLAGGADKLAGGADKLADGTEKSAHGAHKLASGIGGLSDAHGKLGHGAHQLADGLAKGADNVPSYSKSERKQLSNVVSAPVSSPSSNASSIFADASAAGFLIAIALWIGALVTYLVIRAVTGRVLTSSRPSWLLALRGLVPGMIAVASQAVLVTALIGVVMDLSFGVLAELFLFSLLAGAAFVAVNHALVALLGGIGRFISVILVVLAAASNVLSAVPQFFSAIAPFLPLTPAINGLRAVAGDGSGIGAAAGGLLAWIVLGVAASIIAVVRRRSASPDGVGHPVLS